MKKLTKRHDISTISVHNSYDDDDEEEVEVFIGDIAENYLRKFSSVSGADNTFGLRDKDGKFYIENREAKIKENNIIVGDRNTLARLNYETL